MSPWYAGSSPYCVLNSTACVWQGRGMSLMTCVRIFTAVELFCITICSPVLLSYWCSRCSVPMYLHTSANLSHFCHCWDVTLCPDVCVCLSVCAWGMVICFTVVAGPSQWQAMVLIWCRVSPCRCWELDKQWVICWIVSHFSWQNSTM